MSAASGEYQVTARKWRPTMFATVVGQDHITHTLINAIKSDRVHHAYLFSGPRGVGKTTTARILARALNCLNPSEEGEPCGSCESCMTIAEGRSMDVVEIDGASNNSVDDIRGLRDSAKYPPVTGTYKLYIIDEVHMLSTSAFNALLKTLEEPPAHLIFVFATTEPHKVLPTILSRCQRFDFRRMQVDAIVSRLKLIAEKENMTPEEDALVVIARKADGSMRDAQSIFDQVRAFCGEGFTYDQVHDALNLIDQEFFFQITTMMREGNPAAAFDIVEHIMATGYDVEEFLVGLAEHFRHLLSVLTIGSARLIETVDAMRQRYESESREMGQGDLIRALRMTLETQREIRSVAQPRLRLELLLTRLAVMERTVDLDRLMKAIEGMPEGGGEVTFISEERRTSDVTNVDAESSTKSPAPSVEETSSKEKDESEADQAVVPESKTTPESDEGGTQGVLLAPSSKVQEHDARFKSFPTGTPVRSASPRLIPRTTSPDASGERSEEMSGKDNMRGVTINEVQEQWSVFREHYRTTPRLMIALEPATPAEIQGNVLELCVQNEQQLDMIDRYSEDINNSVRSFFKQPLSVEAVIREASAHLDEKNGTSDDSSVEAVPEEIDHPFVHALIGRLGAVRI